MAHRIERLDPKARDAAIDAYHDTGSMDTAITVYLAALPPPTVAVGEVRVKALEWVQDNKPTDDIWRASTGTGMYRIWGNDSYWFFDHNYWGHGKAASFDEAKAAVQAHFDAATRSALVPPPPQTDRGWENLSCDDQYTLARQIAANVGYVLTPEPSIQEAEDAPSPPPQVEPKRKWRIGRDLMPEEDRDPPLQGSGPQLLAELQALAKDALSNEAEPPPQGEPGSALGEAIEWIQKAPEATWGYGSKEDGYGTIQQWPLRDELVSRLQAAFLAPQGEPVTEAVEQYVMGLLTEEAGEILQWLGKSFRFGIDTPGRLGTDGKVTGETPRTLLPDELGDMLAAIDFAVAHGMFDYSAIEAARTRKLAKLLNPDARDNLGRPLAPQLINDVALPAQPTAGWREGEVASKLREIAEGLEFNSRHIIAEDTIVDAFAMLEAAKGVMADYAAELRATLGPAPPPPANAGGKL